jgi:hypothetical protein
MGGNDIGRSKLSHVYLIGQAVLCSGIAKSREDPGVCAHGHERGDPRERSVAVLARARSDSPIVGE